MKIVIKKITLSLVAVMTLGVGLAPAATVLCSAWRFDSGYGDVTITPGVNATEYVIFGNSAATVIAYSPDTTITKGITTSGGGLVSGGAYESGILHWSGSDIAPTAGSTLDLNMGNVAPLSTGYGTSPTTSAAVGVLSAPASNFTMDLVVHDYYASADLEVSQGGSTVGLFTNIMSSSGTRSCDFFFHLEFTGMQAGAPVDLQLNNFQNQGSDWSNVAIHAAILNYTAPETFGEPTVTLANTVPEPSSLVLAFGSIALLIHRRRQS